MRRTLSPRPRARREPRRRPGTARSRRSCARAHPLPKGHARHATPTLCTGGARGTALFTGLRCAERRVGPLRGRGRAPRGRDFVCASTDWSGAQDGDVCAAHVRLPAGLLLGDLLRRLSTVIRMLGLCTSTGHRSVRTRGVGLRAGSSSVLVARGEATGQHLASGRHEDFLFPGQTAISRGGEVEFIFSIPPSLASAIERAISIASGRRRAAGGAGDTAKKKKKKTILVACEQVTVRRHSRPNRHQRWGTSAMRAMSTRASAA